MVVAAIKRYTLVAFWGSLQNQNTSLKLWVRFYPRPGVHRVMKVHHHERYALSEYIQTGSFDAFRRISWKYAHRFPSYFAMPA